MQTQIYNNMYISNRTKVIVKLLQLPGIGTRIADKVAERLIESGCFENSDIRNYVDLCIDKGFIRLKKKLSSEDYITAFEKAYKIINDSFDKGINIISKYDEDFPTSLRRLVDDSGKDISPIVLNYIGDIKILNKKDAIAIIGTRKPTREGEDADMYYSKYFAQKGFNVVSGLALGCDAIAHEGTLSVNGITTAVLAHGLHTISPKKNEHIANEIIEKGGLLLSEYFIGTPAYTTYFVERDRLQAGLSSATIVIQTSIKGGTMHAARATMNNNKILACVRYKNEELRTGDETSGNEFLIRMGAHPLRSADELFDLIKSGQKFEYRKTNPQLKFE